MKIATTNPDVVNAVAQSIPVLTQKEVQIALAARKACEKAKKQAAEAEKGSKAALLVVFSKALGINKLDELSHMSPKEVGALLAKRLAHNSFIKEDGADFAIDKTYEAARPAWKELFEQYVSGAKALEIQNSTPKQYAYGVTEP